MKNVDSFSSHVSPLIVLSAHSVVFFFFFKCQENFHKAAKKLHIHIDKNDSLNSWFLYFDVLYFQFVLES